MTISGIENRIRKVILECCGGSNQTFADTIDINVSTIQKWKGEKFPNGDILFRIRDKFNVSIDWLVTGQGDTYINKDGKPAPVGPHQVVDRNGLWGETQEHTVEGKTLPVTLFTPPEGPAPGPQTEGPETKPIIREQMTRAEIALVHTLRLCGDEYKKRVYIAATVRAQNVIEKRKLETKEKLKAQEDLETLSTAAIE